MRGKQQEPKEQKLYLQYQVGEKYYANAINDVFLIIKSFSILRLPGTPDSMIGAIYHGGMILPVVDMCWKFGAKPCENQQDDYSIVVFQLDNELSGHTGRVRIGALVDSISDIRKVDSSGIYPVPDDISTTPLRYVKEMISENDRTLFIPEINKLFGEQELNNMLDACEKI